VEVMSFLRIILAIMLLAIMSFSSVSQETESEELTAPVEPAAPQPDTRPLDEIFLPSQEIDADEEIVFPVNI
jgi:hypothetical protein